MSAVQVLREKRDAARKAIMQLRDVIAKEDRDFNSEERAAWDKSNKEFDDLGARIDVIERGEAVERAMSGDVRPQKPGAENLIPVPEKKLPKGQQRAEAEALALQAWMLCGFRRQISDAHKRACKLVGVNPKSEYFDVRLTRAQSAGTNSEGGYTVKSGFVANLERALKEFDCVRQVADIFTTENGEPLPWPTINDTGSTGALLAENAQASEAALTFGQTSFGNYKATSGIVLVSTELEEDSVFEMAETVGSLLGERLGRRQAIWHTTGTGSSQPAGIVTGATSGKTAASTTAIAADELIDLFHSVDPAYRDRPGTGWMMHDTVAAAIRKLKDSENRYLWDLDTFKNGQPAMLLGKPVYINQNMASSIAASAKTVLFGDMKTMKIRDVGRVRIKRLVERYADYDQVGYIAFYRGDSKVLNAGTNPIKYLVQAAA